LVAQAIVGPVPAAAPVAKVIVPAPAWDVACKPPLTTVLNAPVDPVFEIVSVSAPFVPAVQLGEIEIRSVPLADPVQ
jgi:hypothetical protein